MSDQRRLFDIASAVSYLQALGASTATKCFVRSLISSAQVPFLRIGRKFFITKEALDSWISKRERRVR